MRRIASHLIPALCAILTFSAGGQSPSQLESWLKRFPQADLDGDGRLTVEEVRQFRAQPTEKTANGKPKPGNRGVRRTFTVDPGWEQPRFPDDAVCYRSPADIRAIYAAQVGDRRAVVSHDPPKDGALRIVGTGHSFMAPGYRTFPMIARAAGLDQPLYTHTGGGMTGSARYKWEQENGIFQFAGKPVPKLLASIANAKWDAMMWGPYFNDRPEFYSCWMEFSLKYNPHMKFYLSDAWPQLYQLDETPRSEDYFTAEIFERLGRERVAGYLGLVEQLRHQYGPRVFILPTSDAMVLAAKHHLRGELPGVEGINRIIGGRERSLWKDQLGHLGPGFERLEGYVFYATIYGRSPELIEQPIEFGDRGGFPGPGLDRIFRKIAWQAVIHHPLSGVTDRDNDGIKD